MSFRLRMNEPGMSPSNAVGNVRNAGFRRTGYGVLAAMLMAGFAAGCTPTTTTATRDVGNMAYPAPLPQGNVETTAIRGRQPADTGNMAYPDPLPQGNIATTAVSGRRPLDTGNMAYPAPQPAGNIATTVVR